MSKLKFKTAFNRDISSVKDVNCKKFTSPNKVKKSLGYAVDINNIYEQYCRTGKMPLNGQQPIYDENYVNYDNLISAAKMVEDASQYFAGLPSEIKSQYGNNMYDFIKALNKCDQFLIDKGVLQIKQPDFTANSSFSENSVKTENSASTVENSVNTATTD